VRHIDRPTELGKNTHRGESLTVVFLTTRAQNEKYPPISGGIIRYMDPIFFGSRLLFGGAVPSWPGGLVLLSGRTLGPQMFLPLTAY
jgi:hypothetical protein